MRGQLEELIHTGHRLYVEGSLRECAESFRRAGEMARALHDRASQVHARFWEGASLHGEGRLEEALARMGPPLTWTDVSLADGDVYRLATRYLRVLVELPAERQRVERAIRQVEEGLARTGRPWRSRVVILRARLALSSGEWRAGLHLAHESLESSRSDPFRCSTGSHYWILVLLSAWLGETELAWRHLDAWSRTYEPFPDAEGYRAWLRSCALRREGRAPQALEHARQAHVESLRGHEYSLRVLAGVELTRTLLALGEVPYARKRLAELMRLRSTSVAEHAFALRVLLADYHHARARALAGLPALDPEFGFAYERPARGSKPQAAGARRAAARAGLCYARARPRGSRLDRLYGLPLREWQLAERVAALRRTQEELD